MSSDKMNAYKKQKRYLRCKRQLQQRSRQKGTATQERWLFPFFM